MFVSGPYVTESAAAGSRSIAQNRFAVQDVDNDIGMHFSHSNTFIIVQNWMKGKYKNKKVKPIHYW